MAGVMGLGATPQQATNAVAASDPGPSLDAVMLRDSIDLVTDLDYHCGRNHDGVLDAADYLLYNRTADSESQGSALKARWDR